MKKHGGFFKILVIIIIGVLIIGYFQIDIRSYIDSPQVAKVLSYAKSTVFYIWNNYLDTPVLYVWNTAILGVIWPTINTQILERIKPYVKDWLSTNSEELVPSISE